MPEIKPLFKKNYLAMIRNAAKGENHMFRNFYAVVDGREQDVLQDGQLGCAAFVSSVLTLQRLIEGPHATVASTERALEAGGWVQIPDVRPGAVLTWEPITYADGQTHLHIGFSLGGDRAVSNASNDAGVPREHHATYDDARKIIRIWWHPKSDE